MFWAVISETITTCDDSATSRRHSTFRAMYVRRCSATSPQDLVIPAVHVAGQMVCQVDMHSVHNEVSCCRVRYRSWWCATQADDSFAATLEPLHRSCTRSTTVVFASEERKTVVDVAQERFDGSKVAGPAFRTRAFEKHGLLHHCHWCNDWRVGFAVRGEGSTW